MLQIIKNDILYIFNSSILFVKKYVSEADEIIKNCNRKELFGLLVIATFMTCFAITLTILSAIALSAVLYITYGVPLILLLVFYLLVVYRETTLKKKDKDVVN